MLTDRPPRLKALLADFRASDQLAMLELPLDDRMRGPAKAIEAAMKDEEQNAVRKACAEFLTAAADFYQVSKPAIRVLASRPLRVYESGWASELFGDYDLKTKRIRVWMRTPVRKQITSSGTFLSTLAHEFCHHLDYEKFGFRDSPHTRGFYERTAALYHHARQTPPKRLFWAPLSGNDTRFGTVGKHGDGNFCVRFRAANPPRQLFATEITGVPVYECSVKFVCLDQG